MFVEINGTAYNLYSIAIIKKVDFMTDKETEYAIEYKSNSGGVLVEKFVSQAERDTKYTELLSK